MIVRKATVDDLNQLAVLFDEYRQFYGASSNLNLSQQFLKQRFENQESVIFIHIKDEVFTGFILLYLGFSSVACSTYYILDDVYVTPQFRRQGSAKQLIDTAICLHDMKMRFALASKRKKPIVNLIGYTKLWVLLLIMSLEPTIVSSNSFSGTC